jgi:hypothetical protein
MEIEKKDLCRHENLIQNCPNCQIHQFLMSKHLRKDILRNKIFPYLKKEQQIWTFDIRGATYEEHLYDPPCSRGPGFGGMIFGTRDDVPLDKQWPCYKLLFMGSKESLMGFMCCFLFKYGTNMIPSLDEYAPEYVSDEIEQEFSQNFSWSDVLKKCMFKRCPDKKAIVIFSTEDLNFHYFATNSIKEFLDGYRKMFDLNIPNIYIQQGPWKEDYIEGIVYKEPSHEKNCEVCKTGNAYLGISGKILVDSGVQRIKTDGKSKAYFYKV